MNPIVKSTMSQFSNDAVASSALCLSLLGFSAWSSAETLELIQSVPQNTTLRAPHTSIAADAWLKLIQSAKRSIELQVFT